MAGFDNKSFAAEVQAFEQGHPPYQQFSQVIDVDLSAAVKDKLIYEGAGNVVAILAKTLDSQNAELSSDTSRKFYLKLNRKDYPAILMSGAADAAAGTNNLIAGTIWRLYLTITAAQVAAAHVYLIVATAISLGTGNSGPAGGTVVAPASSSSDAPAGSGSGAGAGAPPSPGGNFGGGNFGMNRS